MAFGSAGPSTIFTSMCFHWAASAQPLPPTSPPQLAPVLPPAHVVDLLTADGMATGEYQRSNGEHSAGDKLGKIAVSHGRPPFFHGRCRSGAAADRFRRVSVVVLSAAALRVGLTRRARENGGRPASPPAAAARAPRAATQPHRRVRPATPAVRW